MLLREVSYFYSEFLFDYQEALNKITDALYIVSKQNE